MDDSPGRSIRADPLLLLLNGGEQELPVTLPVVSDSGRWHVLVDTADADEPPTGRGAPPADEPVLLRAHALMLLQHEA